jgi:demethylmenaquinone methyltransferase / 2-methoxy-6-polyprenyl-1,4-benzoquinol methylase
MNPYEKANPLSIRALFNSIAPKYDFGNAVLSGNLHRLWNRRLVAHVACSKPTDVVDLCCGTGEIARRMMQKMPNSNYTLVDFSEEMLDLAKNRIKEGHCTFCQADAESLPLPDASFDSATCAYGIRNILNRANAFTEVYRVLKPGAIFGIVELTRPSGRFLGALHRFYLRTMVPLVGRAITSNEAAYKYLCKSIEAFVPSEQIVRELEDAGFVAIEVVPQTFGIATLFFAKKK